MLGDLKNGRTVHSLVNLLCTMYSVRLNFVSPESLAMPASVVSAAKRAGVQVRQCESLDEVLDETDVLYVTRVQKERFTSEEEWEKASNFYRVDHSVLSRAKEDMIVMHPLPRVNGMNRAVKPSFLFPGLRSADNCGQKSTLRSTLIQEGLYISGRCGTVFS